MINLDTIHINLDFTQVNLDTIHINLDTIHINLDITEIGLDIIQIYLDKTQIYLPVVITQINQDITQAYICVILIILDQDGSSFLVFSFSSNNYKFVTHWKSLQWTEQQIGQHLKFWYLQWILRQACTDRQSHQSLCCSHTQRKEADKGSGQN